MADTLKASKMSKAGLIAQRLTLWTEDHGFTLRELAAIQPGYTPRDQIMLLAIMAGYHTASCCGLNPTLCGLLNRKRRAEEGNKNVELIPGPGSSAPSGRRSVPCIQTTIPRRETVETTENLNHEGTTTP